MAMRRPPIAAALAAVLLLVLWAAWPSEQGTPVEPSAPGTASDDPPPSGADTLQGETGTTRRSGPIHGVVDGARSGAQPIRMVGRIAPEPRLATALRFELGEQIIELAGAGEFDIEVPVAAQRVPFRIRDAEDRWLVEGTAPETQPSQEGHIDLGTLTLELRPVVRLHFETDDVARRVAALYPDARMTVEVALAGAPTSGAMPWNQRKRIAEFFPDKPALQEDVVRLPRHAANAQGHAVLRWRFESDQDDSTIVQTTELDLIAGPLSTSLVLTSDHTLTGRIVSEEQGLANMSLSMLARLPTTLQSGQTRSNSTGQYGMFVPRGSSGTIWPALLGQRASVDWIAGQRADVAFDREEVVAVRVVDEDGAPLPAFSVGRTTWSRWVVGARILRPVHNDAVFLAVDSLDAGSALLVRVPGSPERLFLTPRALRAGEDPFPIPLADTTAADGSLTLVVSPNGPSQITEAQQPDVLLEPAQISLKSTREIQGRRPFRYVFRAERSETAWSDLFPGTYHFEVWQNRTRLAEGEVAIEPGRTARIEAR